MDRRQMIRTIGVRPGCDGPASGASGPLPRCVEADSLRAEVQYGRIGYPYGEKPDGRITYDKAGRMSAELMRPGRRSTVAPGASFVTGNASAEEIREAVEGLIA